MKGMWFLGNKKVAWLETGRLSEFAFELRKSESTAHMYMHFRHCAGLSGIEITDRQQCFEDSWTMKHNNAVDYLDCLLRISNQLDGLAQIAESACFFYSEEAGL
jgi:hypothetical protein